MAHTQEYRDGYLDGYHLEAKAEGRSTQYQAGYSNGRTNRLGDEQDRPTGRCRAQPAQRR
jgi:hypothetical protein